MEINTCKPFLNWVGGKRRLLQKIRTYLPSPESINRYYEPFVGGGAMFFGIPFKNSWLSDANAELMQTYLVVQKTPGMLLRLLKSLQEQHSEEFYYHVRGNTPQSPLIMSSLINVAARFMYLNRACFNGLYRVNGSGVFNVPIGRDKNGELNVIYDEHLLYAIDVAGLVLRKRCEMIGVFDYREAIESAGRGDFIYFDPPYYGHRDYTTAGFGNDDHVELADVFNGLSEKGVKAAITNANTTEVRELYEGNDIIELSVRHNVSGKSKGRKKVKELLIRNYDKK